MLVRNPTAMKQVMENNFCLMSRGNFQFSEGNHRYVQSALVMSAGGLKSPRSGPDATPLCLLKILSVIAAGTQLADLLVYLVQSAMDRIILSYTACYMLARQGLFWVRAG